MTRNLTTKQQPKMSVPKRIVLDFVKTTDYGKEYQFLLDGTDLMNPKQTITYDEAVTRAVNFVHRMRVELARFRLKIREKHKRVPVKFKMLIARIELLEKEQQVRVTLIKSEGNLAPIQRDIDEAFADLAGGEIINVN